MQELDLSRSVTVLALITFEGEQDQLKVERDQLKALVEGFEAALARARKEAVQEYRANFKETRKYTYVLNDAFEEYKASLKRVDPNFNAEYYDNLIL